MVMMVMMVMMMVMMGVEPSRSRPGFFFCGVCVRVLFGWFVRFVCFVLFVCLFMYLFVCLFGEFLFVVCSFGLFGGFASEIQVG